LSDDTRALSGKGRCLYSAQAARRLRLVCSLSKTPSQQSLWSVPTPAERFGEGSPVGANYLGLESHVILERPTLPRFFQMIEILLHLLLSKAHPLAGSKRRTLRKKSKMATSLPLQMFSAYLSAPSNGSYTLATSNER
jgi:hypothetical protein